ncbi:hypothetical protein, partial [Pseudomonas putida]|uniref:hypothetical protein n=1 Tax=Pseudomonas putida TaxID=303 RepID=UPI001C401271
FAGLLALAGILGIGKGHLLHQVSRRLKSGILPNLEVLFRVSLSITVSPSYGDMVLVALPVEGSPIADKGYSLFLSSSKLDPGFVPDPPFHKAMELRGSAGLWWNLGPFSRTNSTLTVGGDDFPCPVSFSYGWPR